MMVMATKNRSTVPQTTQPVPSTEVTPKAKRRRFSASFKAKVLAEADACTEPGQVGAVLRRYGIYSSHLAFWRAARDKGALQALSPKPRGPKPEPRDQRDERISELQAQISALTVRAERAEALVELQKKLASVLESLSSPSTVGRLS